MSDKKRKLAAEALAGVGNWNLFDLDAVTTCGENSAFVSDFTRLMLTHFPGSSHNVIKSFYPEGYRLLHQGLQETEPLSLLKTSFLDHPNQRTHSPPTGHDVYDWLLSQNLLPRCAGLLTLTHYLIHQRIPEQWQRKEIVAFRSVIEVETGKAGSKKVHLVPVLNCGPRPPLTPLIQWKSLDKNFGIAEQLLASEE